MTPSLLSKIFKEHRITHVFHLAAYAAEGLSHFIRRFNYTNNVVGSMNVLNEAVKAEVRCFVFTSSIAVYGAGQTPMRESLTPEPEDPYGIAKYAVEMDLHAARRMFGIDSIIFRPHNVYGERQHIGDRYRNVIGIFMNQLMRGEPMSIFGDGSQTRAFSYIGDVAPLIADSIDVPAALNQVFNIGADEPTPVNELAVKVARAMGREPAIRYHEARQGSAPRGRRSLTRGGGLRLSRDLVARPRTEADGGVGAARRTARTEPPGGRRDREEPSAELGVTPRTLNIGSGRRYRPKAVNVDAAADTSPDVVHDLFPPDFWRLRCASRKRRRTSSDKTVERHGKNLCRRH